MPNAIKYSLSAQTLALKKGNFFIGTGDVGKGPTSTTDYYNGITPGASGYTIYLNKASGGPSIYCPANDAALISLSNTIAGQTFATAAAALDWYNSQTDKMVFNIDYPAIVTDGLVLNLDAGFTPSYPTTGTTWYDLSGNNYTHTIINPSATTNFQGVQCFDCSTNAWVDPVSSTFTFTQNYTMIAWVNALADTEVGTWRTLWRTTPNDHPILIQDGTDLIGYYDNNSAGFVSYGSTLAGLGLSNKWTMFTITGTGGSTYLYYNNATYVGSVAYSADGNNHDTIGNVSGGSQPFGYLASALLYNRPLSIAEITQNYNAVKSRFGL